EEKSRPVRLRLRGEVVRSEVRSSAVRRVFSRASRRYYEPSNFQHRQRVEIVRQFHPIKLAVAGAVAGEEHCFAARRQAWMDVQLLHMPAAIVAAENARRLDLRGAIRPAPQQNVRRLAADAVADDEMAVVGMKMI